MADDHTQRTFRSQGSAGRTASGNGGAGYGANDPLAELARLIGQNDPFGEFGRKTAPPTAPAESVPDQPLHAVRDPRGMGTDYPEQGYVEPSAPNSGAYRTEAPVSGYPDLYADSATAPYDSYDPNNGPYADEGQDFYDDAPPPRRRVGAFAIAAVLALAVVGTAGAYGYRTLFGSIGSGPPPVIKADIGSSKILPPKKDSQSAKLINDRVSDHGEKLVSRQEQPMDLKDQPTGMVTQEQGVAAANSGPVLGSGILDNDPKKVQTITIRPDQSTMADAAPTTTAAPAGAQVADAAAPVQSSAQPPAAQAEPPAPAPAPTRHIAEPPHRTAERTVPPQHRERREARAESNAPLSLNPNAPAPQPTRTASVEPARTAPAEAGHAVSRGYAVQVSSRRSEAEAQAAARALKGKFSRVLGGQPVMVRRVDLGSKGVYYRAMVGPFTSSDAASKLCHSLKAAGGSCFVQRI